MNLFAFKVSKGIDSDILSINKMIHVPLQHIENTKLYYSLFTSTLFHFIVIYAFISRMVKH